MDRSVFFGAVRKSVFGGKLSSEQVTGTEALLNEGQRRGTQTEQLAYILATAFHETARTMQPVRETLAKTDADAIGRLDRAYAAGRMPQVKRPYWRRDAEGKTWLGRGFVQVTHRDNYAKFDLTADPSKAMEMPVAIRVIFDGMEKGLFSKGNTLSKYINGKAVDYVGARWVVNGTDKAALIAGYAKDFEAALRAAKYLPVAIQPRPTIPAETPKPPVSTGGAAAAVVVVAGGTLYSYWNEFTTWFWSFFQ